MNSSNDVLGQRSASRGGQDRPGRRSASSASRWPSFSRSRRPRSRPHRDSVVACHVGRARAPARKARRRFQRLPVRLPHRPDLQGQLYRNGHGCDFRVPVERATGHRSGQRGLDRDDDGGKRRGLSGLRVDAGPGRAVRSDQPICRPSPAITRTSTATCCRFRSTHRRRFFTTTRHCSRSAGLNADAAPRTWPEVEARRAQAAAAGMACGFTTHWPSWVNVENFSALHDLPIATEANGFGGLDATLTINNPILVRHIGKLAEWQKTRLFDYSGRAMTAEPRFPSRRMRHLPRFVGGARRYPCEGEVRGRLRHAALLARCRRQRRRIRSSAARRCGC